MLSETDRQRVYRGLMRWWSREREALGDFTKPNLKAAVDATDAFIDDNQVAYNNSLPEPFKSEATAVQKTLLFCAVALARVGISILRRVFGEVD